MRGTSVLGDKRKGLEEIVFILRELGIFILVYCTEGEVVEADVTVS